MSPLFKQPLPLQNAYSIEIVIRVVADVWKKDVWEFQAKSGSWGSCRLFLHFLRKIAVQEMSGKTPGAPRHPSSRHPRPSKSFPRLCLWRFLQKLGCTPKGSYSTTREQKRQIRKKSHKISENPLDGLVFVGHPAGVPAKMPFSVRLSIRNNRKCLGHRPVDPCLSRWVSQKHPAGVPGIFLKFMCPSLSWTARF